MQLTYDEYMDILDIKYILSERTGYTLPPGINEISDINKTLEYLSPEVVEDRYTIDDIRLKPNLKNNQTLSFTKKSFFYTKLGFTQSYSGPLWDIDGSIQLKQGRYKSNKHITITAIDKILLKSDCINGSIVNGIQESILYNFALSSSPDHKTYKTPRILLFEKKYKSVLVISRSI